MLQIKTTFYLIIISGRVIIFRYLQWNCKCFKLTQNFWINQYFSLSPSQAANTSLFACRYEFIVGNMNVTSYGWRTVAKRRHAIHIRLRHCDLYNGRRPAISRVVMVSRQHLHISDVMTSQWYMYWGAKKRVSIDFNGYLGRTKTFLCSLNTGW